MREILYYYLSNMDFHWWFLGIWCPSRLKLVSIISISYTMWRPWLLSLCERFSAQHPWKFFLISLLPLHFIYPMLPGLCSPIRGMLVMRLGRGQWGRVRIGKGGGGLNRSSIIIKNLLCHITMSKTFQKYKSCVVFLFICINIIVDSFFLNKRFGQVNE